MDNRTETKRSNVIVPRDVATITRECEVFTHYLVGQLPTDYIRKQYGMAALARNLANNAEFTAFDRTTLRFARRNVFFTRVADAYCAIFYRHGILRRKLILLLAILEHTAPTAAQFELPKNSGSIEMATNLLREGICFLLSLLAGVFLLPPFHLFWRNVGESEK